MTKQSKVKPDIILKNFWKNNERFADIFNAYLFQGEQIIKSEDLVEADTDISSLVKFNRHAETLGKVFDVVKKSANGVDYVILGLENQSKIHYAMPLRHMIGDAFSYLKEYKELEAKNKKYKNYKTKHEFLSKFQKTDRLHPIVTICIYYGEDEWDGPRSLIDMLDIPEEFESLKLEQEGVELNMCKALEELEERGREKGRIEGRVEGAIKIYKKMEASREDTIKNIMEDFSLDKEVADKYVEEYY